MTEDLQTLLHERARTTPMPTLDVGAITRDGRRRVRRRRVAAAAGVVAVAAVLGAGAGFVLPRTSHDAVDQPGRDGRISWSDGHVIHVGDRIVDPGQEGIGYDRRIISYVRTAVGFGFVDQRGYVWSVHDGDVDRVGATSTEDPHLAVDPDGTRFGWVGSMQDMVTFNTMDQETGKTHYDLVSTQGRPAGVRDRMIAIDGRLTYWQDADGTWETDLGADGQSAQGAAVAPGWTLLTADDGWGVRRNDSTGHVTVGRVNEEGVTLSQAIGTNAVLSPDHHWVALYGGGVTTRQPELFDTRTGDRVTVDLDGSLAVGYEWLDDDTVAVLAAATLQSDYSLMTCSVPDGSCTVAVPDVGEGPDDRNATGFVLPTGDPYYVSPQG
jgi:hypothetical protein